MANQQELTLADVVNGRIFVVPDYQRPYAWGQKHLQDMWDDLDLMGQQGHHYTGTLVLLERQGGVLTTTQDALTEWEVVDGQQRLTTTFLLLDRLRRRLSRLDDANSQSLADDLRKTYGEVTGEWEPRARIQLAGELNDYWHHSVLNDRPATLAGMHSGHTLLKKAAEFFDEQIAGLESADQGDLIARLTDLTHRVTHGLRFLVYEVSSSADVGVIFETLNDRGRDLTELEKIKNYLLYLARLMPDSARERVVNHVNTSWAAIFDNFAAAPSLNEDSVLRAHWITTQDSDARNWKGAATVKKVFPRSKYVPDTERLVASSDESPSDPWQTLRNDILGYVDSLKLCSLFAREVAVSQPQFVDFGEESDRAASASETLRNTRFSPARFYPILFGTRLAHPRDGALYTEMVRLCETFIVRVLLVSQWRTHTGASSMNRLGRDIYTGTVDPNGAAARFVGMIRYYADDAAVRNHLARPDNWYGRNGHKFLLYEYERSLLRPGTRMPSLSTFLDKGYKETTEHILPQTPRKRSQWLKDFSKQEERKALTDTLGNLMLTMDNSRYSNRDYADKRGRSDAPADVACYFNGLRQELDVAKNYTQWTPAEVLDRQSKLTAWILDRWPLPAVKSDDEPSDEALADDTAVDEEQATAEESEEISA